MHMDADIRFDLDHNFSRLPVSVVPVARHYADALGGHYSASLTDGHCNGLTLASEDPAKILAAIDAWRAEVLRAFWPESVVPVVPMEAAAELCAAVQRNGAADCACGVEA